MTLKSKPNYYSIIPAPVRYDKNLKANEKLLYGEITSLSNKEGYCWASNSYFSKLYGVTKQTVSRWINSLEKNGYIKTEIDKPCGNKRRMYITEKFIGIKQKNNTPIAENVNTPNPASTEHDNYYTNNFEPNITSINNKTNNKINKNNNNNPKLKIPYQKIKDLYNSICKSLPPLKAVTSKRRKKIQNRSIELNKLCEEGQTELDLLKLIFEKTEASNFLTGKTKNNNPKYKDFSANFNWLMENDTNYVKVLEGKYDNKPKWEVADF